HHLAAGDRALRLGTDDGAELNHPAQAVLRTDRQGEFGARSGVGDLAAIALKVRSLHAAAQALVGVALRRDAGVVELALAGLRQQIQAGRAAFESKLVVLAGQPPDELAAAADEAAPQVVAQ